MQATQIRGRLCLQSPQTATQNLFETRRRHLYELQATAQSSQRYRSRSSSSGRSSRSSRTRSSSSSRRGSSSSSSSGSSSSSTLPPPRCDAQTSYFLDLLWSEMLCFTALFSVVMESGNSSWFRVYFL